MAVVVNEMSDATPPCAHPAHREFDYWIGEWDVFDADATLAGRNVIEPLFGGCVLRETWNGTAGVRGTSLNVHSEGRGAWHQTWVDSTGSLLLLDGGLRGGAMVMEGSTPAPDDPAVTLRHRISWSVTDGDPNRVRQHWQVSRDDGQTWETAFDGRYERRQLGE
jgi:hypothetical protein